MDSKAESKSMQVEVIAEAQVKNTESRDKVAKAVQNLFRSHGEMRYEEDRVQFVSEDIESLRFLKDQFRDRRVRAAARRLMQQNSKGESMQTYLLLNKQAATVSIAAICDDPRESALGPIVLRIRSPVLDRVIEWLTFGYDIAERS